MVFLPEPTDQDCDLAHQSLARPGGECAPVALGMLPQDLDQVELRAVGRQVQPNKAVFDQPAIHDLGLDIQVNRRVVHDDEGELRAVAGLQGQAFLEGQRLIQQTAFEQGLGIDHGIGLKRKAAVIIGGVHVGCATLLDARTQGQLIGKLGVRNACPFTIPSHLLNDDKPSGSQAFLQCSDSAAWPGSWVSVDAREFGSLKCRQFIPPLSKFDFLTLTSTKPTTTPIVLLKFVAFTTAPRLRLNLDY